LQVYEALRDGPEWNDTLLLVTYDEHGGFWDAEAPPQEGVPSPKPGLGSYPDNSFAWNRLGIRVPMIAVSPRIPRGTVVSEPPAAQKPFPTSRYEHTSMMATVRKLLGIDSSHYLTERDRWAATFEHVLSLDQPRATPRRTPAAPLPTLKDEHLKPVNDLQKLTLEVHGHFGGTQPHEAALQGKLDLAASYQRIVASMKQATDALVVMFGAEQPGVHHPNLLTNAWLVDGGRIATRYPSKTHGAQLCLTPQGNQTVGVAVCNHSPAQAMWFEADFTIQNSAGECLTVQEPQVSNPAYFGHRPASFLPCVDSVTQHYAYSGAAPGNDYSGQIWFGAYDLAVYETQ
jgi:hypothetical protein